MLGIYGYSQFEALVEHGIQSSLLDVRVLLCTVLENSSWQQLNYDEWIAITIRI